MSSLFSVWQAGPVRPVAESGALHLWRCRLDGEGVGEATLSAKERERAERFKIPVLRARFVRSRHALRAILARYVGESPDALVIETPDTGKPFLSGGSGLRFNISHAGDLLVVAVTQGSEVGVDVERTDERVHTKEIAARFFFSEEQAEIAATLPDPRMAFFQMWTAKEAVMKLTSEGLAVGLSRTRISLNPLQVEGSATVLTAFDPGTGYAGAAATEFLPAATRLWDFTPI